MDLPSTEKFEFNGKTFDTNTMSNGNRFSVSVTLDGEQTSPAYSVDLETHVDFFMQHKESLVDHLKPIAKSDIEAEMYFKG